MFPQENQDVIDVRPDERFDENRLAEFLADKLEGAHQKMTVRQFGNGAANLTYLLRFGETREYVFRRPPLGPVAPSAHDMAREYKVLSVLHQAFDYAPRACLFSDDKDIVGAPFIIMERCHGTVVRRVMPAHYAKLPDAPRQMSRALVDALAAFHAVDYAALGLEDLGRPQGFIQRQVEGWHRRWRRAKLDDSPKVDESYRWLIQHLPTSSDSTLVHNDWKLDNTLFATADPAKLVAVLDWDMCTLGDPLSDLGTLLTYWTQADDPPQVKMFLTMPAGYPFLTRRQLVERYARKSGRDLADIRFYHVLGIFRLLVILQQIYIRYRRGQTRDERFAKLGGAVDALAETAVQAARGEFA